MYSQKVTQKNLEMFAAQEGWMPEPRSLDEVEELKERIDSLVTIESNRKSTYVAFKNPISARRSREIRRWIENEQILCALDSCYFESRYAYLLNETGEIVKFKNRRSQEVLDAIFAETEEEEKSTELLLLGARQTGVVTKIALKFLHRLLFIPHTQALIASPNPNSRRLTAKAMDITYSQCPWWLVPRKTPKNAIENGSDFVQSGMRARGTPRGWTPTCILLDDVDYVSQPTITIEENLLRSVLSSRNLFLILHGSLHSKIGWLANTYRKAKEYWPKGQSRFHPIFIPWAICSDIYPSQQWIEKHPRPADWIPMPETVDHVARCQNFVQKTSYLSRVTGSNWTMPPEQQWFWEFGYKAAQAEDCLPQYLEQMVADDEELLDEGSDDIGSVFPTPVVTQEKVRKLLQTE